jgi:hypothetical protein
VDDGEYEVNAHIRIIAMKKYLTIGLLTIAIGAGAFDRPAIAQVAASGPDPTEIPVPPIASSMPKMPGVDDLPSRPDMPDPLTMNDGQKVSTPAQ